MAASGEPISGPLVVEHFATIQNYPQAIVVPEAERKPCSQNFFIAIAVVALVAALAVGVGVTVSKSNASNNFPVENRDPAIAFNIQLSFVTSASDAEQAVFQSAVNRLQSVIRADIADDAIIPAGSQFCGQTINVRTVVDDVLIFVSISDIDGPGGVLGQAGPCGFDPANRIRLGSMQFDKADVANLINQGTAQATMLHEMLHVLGVGTVWADKNLVDNTKAPPQYLGQQGNIGNQEIGRAGAAIIEDLGGPGTAGGHWKESVYQTELMTGQIGAGGAPFSLLSVRALADLGYTVDPNRADAFRAPGTGRRLRGGYRDISETVKLTNDILVFEKVILETVPKAQRNQSVGDSGNGTTLNP